MSTNTTIEANTAVECPHCGSGIYADWAPGEDHIDVYAECTGCDWAGELSDIVTQDDLDAELGAWLFDQQDRW